jgi:hypothetical protein
MRATTRRDALPSVYVNETNFGRVFGSRRLKKEEHTMAQNFQSRKRMILMVSVLGGYFAFLLWATGLFAASVRAIRQPASQQSLQSEPSQDNRVRPTNVAFRDGLYVGKIANERGAKPHISVGRWVSQEDRDAYSAGYLQGYSRTSVSVASSHVDE